MTREEKAARSSKRQQQAKRPPLTWDRVRGDRAQFITDLNAIDLANLEADTAATISCQMVTIGMLGLVLDVLKLMHDNTRDRETIRDDALLSRLEGIEKACRSASWT